MALTKAKGHILADDLALAGNPTTTTQSASDNTTKIATTAYVTTAIANLSDSAPSTLNTLNELAAALGDDANYATTTTNAIAAKLPLAGGTMTGTLAMGSNSITSTGTISSGAITGTSATFTDDLAINNGSPELYFGTTGNHYNWRIAAQENTNAALQVDVGSQDTDYSNDSYSSLFTILNTGNVGIGTTSPEKTLHVKAASNQIRIQDSTNDKKYDLNVDGDKFMIDDMTAGANRLTISGANVGIAAASPDSKLIIENNDNSFYRFGYGGTSDIYLDADTVYFRTDNGGANTATLTTTGLGIGITAPNTQLHVARSISSAFSAADSSWHSVIIKNDTAATNNASGIALEVSGSAYHGNAGTGIAAVKNGTNSDYGADLVLITRPQSAVAAERMRIDSTGKVGIGTVSPAAKLVISGNSDTSDEDVQLRIVDLDSSSGSKIPSIAFYGGSTQNARIRGTDAGGVQISSTSANEDDLVIQLGKTGIGTNSPAVAKGLHINSAGNSELRLTTTQDSGTPTAQIGYSAGSGYFFRLADAANNEDVMLRTYGNSVFNGGNVGIGNTSPGFKLTIGGGIGSNQSTAYASMTGRLGFGNDYSDEQRGPNKVVLQNDGNWISGLGISNNSTDYYSGGMFTWMKSNSGTSYSLRMQINASGYLGVGVSPTRLLHVQGSTAGLPIAHFKNTNNDCVGIRAEVDSNAGNNFIYEAMNSDGQQWKIRNDGRHYGTYQSIQSISDERLKKDVSSLTYDINNDKVLVKGSEDGTKRVKFKIDL